MENGNPQKKKLQTSSVISVFVFLADIYFIVNMKSNYAILGVAALATLFCILSTINAWTKWKEADSQRAEEHYVDIMKAEKSTHLVSQKSFQNLDEKLNFIGQKIMPIEKASSANQQKIADMLENLMDGQKKVAKVTISRSKENATALMNSNDQLIQRMEEFQQSILDMKTEVMEKQDEIYNKKLQKMDDNQRELVEKIQESANLFQNIQKMDDSHKELAEKLQESADLFQNLKKVDDNQKELVEKIQESTDLIKNIIEVIPEKIAQMPQLAQREPYAADGFASGPVSGPLPAGQPEFTEEPQGMAEAELPEPELGAGQETLAAQPESEAELEQEVVLDPAEEQAMAEPAEEPIQEITNATGITGEEELEKMLQSIGDLPGAQGAESIRMPLSAEPEIVEMPLADANPEETADMPLADVNPEETADMPLADANPEEIADMPLADVNPEETADMPLTATDPEQVSEAAPIEMLGLAAEQGIQAMPETLAAEHNIQAMPEVLAAEQDIQPMPEAIAAEPDLQPMPEAIAAEPDLQPMLEAIAPEPDLQAMPEAIAPEPDLQAMPEILADSVPAPVDIPQAAMDSFTQPVLAPDPIPTVEPANGMMTPEDIAALLANTAEPEPEPEPEPIPAPFMGNSDGMMSPEEIAALIGNTTVEELPKMANPIEDSIKPPLPDMSDPGKMMSPEDIASLIANM